MNRHARGRVRPRKPSAGRREPRVGLQSPPHGGWWPGRCWPGRGSSSSTMPPRRWARSPRPPVSAPGPPRGPGPRRAPGSPRAPPRGLNTPARGGGGPRMPSAERRKPLVGYQSPQHGDSCPERQCRHVRGGGRQGGASHRGVHVPLASRPGPGVNACSAVGSRNAVRARADFRRIHPIVRPYPIHAGPVPTRLPGTPAPSLPHRAAGRNPEKPAPERCSGRSSAAPCARRLGLAVIDCRPRLYWCPLFAERLIYRRLDRYLHQGERFTSDGPIFIVPSTNGTFTPLITPSGRFCGGMWSVSRRRK